MGTGTPLLNEYKQEFLWKRLPQTVLGGLRLKLGYQAPAYVYIYQFLLFLMPWILGGVFTVLVEEDVMKYDMGIYAYGVLMVLLVLALNIFGAVSRSRCSSISPIALNAQKVLAEDDEVDFISCCGIETLEFILPAKKFKINILLHGLLSGPLCGLGFWYLLPTTLNSLYSDNLAATVLLYALGWVCLSTAQYSLTVAPPPETAMYRTADRWEIGPLMRPFYCLIFFSFDLLARYVSGFTLTNQILHAVFVFVPVLWTVGILPPLDACILWLLEQGLLIVFGGSAMATNLRLIVNVLLSAAVYLVIYFIPHGLQTIILMSAFGYLLSIDLGALGAQVFHTCFPGPKTDSPFQKQNLGFLWHWTPRELAFHLVMLAVVIGTAAGINITTEDLTSSDITDYLAYSVIGLLVLEVMLAEFQKVYVFLGLWRNRLFPSSVQRTTIFHRGKQRLRALGYIRRIIVNFLSPIVMLSYLATSLHFDDVTTSTAPRGSHSTAAVILGSFRAFRWVWQSTHNSLLEISVAHILILVLPDDSSWLQLGIGLQLLIISLCRDRLYQLLNKLYFFVVVLISSWSDKKQRRQSTIPTMALNLFFFPLVFAIISLAAALSAPLLPLFTIPLFLIGHPRPLRSWPEAVGSSANMCPDTVYYRHCAPQLATALRKAFANGSLGEASPGCHYLIRFQDRLTWVQILERGYCYCSLSIKGLELQETSCHAIEATHIDDVIDMTFESEDGFPCCTINSYQLHILRPYDAAVVKTYSDARNQLTGVIDSPDVLQSIDRDFPKTLLWVFIRYILRAKKNNPMGSCDNNTSDSPARPKSVISTRRPETSGAWQKLEPDSPVKEQISGVTTETARPSTAVSRQSRNAACRSPSIRSFADSIWSDDMALEPLDKSTPHKPNLLAGLASRHMNNDVTETETEFNSKRALAPPGVMDDGDDVDKMFGELDLGLPVVDITQEGKGPALQANRHTKGAKAGGVTLLDNAVQFRSPQSFKLAIPARWQEIPVEPSKLAAHLAKFPQDWYKHVIKVVSSEIDCKKAAEEVAMEISQDDILMKMYSQFTIACYTVVNVLGLGGSDPVSLGPSHVHKVYTGDIPWSPVVDWITEDPELSELVLKAYRYSVKLGIDQLLLGEVTSHQELQECLQEYDTDCYIGSEKDIQWSHAVTRGTPQLFSLTFDPVAGSYNSRVLTCQDTPVYVSSVNMEAVRGQWANLNLELLYMTNDDEERHSIQAQTNLLRNLTVQAADPPLGYPIYASEPVSIPTL